MSTVSLYGDVRDTGHDVTRQCQLVLKRMLFVFADICRDFDVDYCLMYQTLADAFHHRGFSPRSSSVHVAVRAEDVDRLKRALQSHVPKDMFVQDSETDPTFTSKLMKLRDRYSNYYEWAAKAPQDTWHNGLQLDIFAYEHIGHRTRVNVVNDHQVKSANLFNDGRCTVTFEGRQLRSPKHADRLLVAMYGTLEPDHLVGGPLDGKANPFEPCIHSASNLGSFKLSSVAHGSRKRMVVLIPHLLVGGATRMAIEVVKQLKLYGWSVWCVETIPPAAGSMHWNERMEPYCVECVYIPRKDVNKLCQFIAANDVSLIWSLAPVAVRRIKATLPNVKFVDQHFNTVHLAHHKKNAAHIDHVITCYDELAREFTVPATPIWVGITPATKVVQRNVAAWKSDHGLDGVSLPIVSFLGRFSSEKRPQWVVDIALLCKDVAIVVAAGEGPLYEDVVADNDARGGGVIFLGHVEEPHLLMEVSSVIIIPSEIEGLPNTMMEAVQRGKHVVITPVGGVPHWKDLGLVHICDHSPSAFSDKIKSLIAHPPKSSKFAFPNEWTAIEMGKRYDETFCAVLDISAPVVDLLQNIHFVNLDKRTDRFMRLTKQIANYQSVTAYPLLVKRFPAISRRPGFVGCSESHVALLKMCLAHSRSENGSVYYTILEDDFEWKMSTFNVKCNLDLLCSSKVKWDVLVLAASKWYFKCGSAPLLPTKQGGFYKTTSCSTTTGYVVRAGYLPKLIANFEQSTHFLQQKCNQDRERYHKYALDQFWKSLQVEDNWIFHKPGFAKQADSFSDIENKVMTYEFH